MKADAYFALVCQLLEARPFKPFVIELRGGTRHMIDEPRALAISKQGGTAYWPAKGGLAIFDHAGVVCVSVLPPDVPIVVTDAK